MKYSLLLACALVFGQVSHTYASTESKQVESIKTGAQISYDYTTVLYQIGNAWAAVHGIGEPYTTWDLIAAEVLSETQNPLDMVDALESVGCGPDDIAIALNAIGS